MPDQPSLRGTLSTDREAWVAQAREASLGVDQAPRPRRGLDTPRPSEFYLLSSKIVEQSYAVAEQDRDQVDLHLVQEARPQGCRTMFAPPQILTFFPPAAARACSSPASIPSVTKE